MEVIEHWPDPEKMTESEKAEAEKRRQEGLRLLARMIARAILREATEKPGAAADGPEEKETTRARRRHKDKQAGEDGNMLYERTEQGLRRFQGELPAGVTDALERADEDSIVAALGDERYSAEYLYRFQADGRELVGISSAGAFEMARLLGCVEVLPEVKTDRDEAGYQIVVRVRDNMRRVTLLGAARQPLRKRVPVLDRDGRETGEVAEKPVENAWVVGVNKAQRNGILRLVSSEARQRIIEDFLARSQEKPEHKQAGVPRQPQPSVPAQPADGSKSNSVGGKADSQPMTPAAFAAGCRQKGYQTSGEVLSALGFPDKRSLLRCGLAKAIEKLPDRHAAPQDPADETDLDDVDLGF